MKLIIVRFEITLQFKQLNFIFKFKLTILFSTNSTNGLRGKICLLFKLTISLSAEKKFQSCQQLVQNCSFNLHLPMRKLQTEFAAFPKFACPIYEMLSGKNI